MPILASINECTGCKACGDACPHNCISFHTAKDGHFYPHVDSTICVECKTCTKVCPIIFPQNIKNKNSKLYAAWSTNTLLRMKSSSGGGFAEIALSVLNQKGIVIGATSRQNKATQHIIIESPNDIELLQGSKYTQSDTTGIYRLCKQHLKQDKNVLFSGTSCQIAGLLNYIPNKLQQKLYTIDLICHGVPSQLLYSKYEKQLKEKISTVISYRDKQNGWKKCYYMTVKTEQGNIIRKDMRESFYLTAFGNNKTMRMSCYECPYKTMTRQSDLTIGDFWGIKRFTKEQEKGISLIICHSEKGEKLLKQSQLNINPANWKECITRNRNLYYAHNIWGKHPARKYIQFFFKWSPMWLLNKLYGNCSSIKYFYLFPLWLSDKIFTRIHHSNCQKALSNITKTLENQHE